MLFKLDRIFGQPSETASMRLNLNRALRIAFRLKVRPEFVSPLDPKAPRLIDLEDLTGVGDPAIGENNSTMRLSSTRSLASHQTSRGA